MEYCAENIKNLNLLASNYCHNYCFPRLIMKINYCSQ